MFKHLSSLNALKTFEAAARLGSFKLAAEELSVTPTAVSHQIRGLEENIGIPLFVRQTRAVHLTPEGQKLSAAINYGFSHINDTLLEISQGVNVLTIATTPAFAALWLVPNIAAFEEEYPNIKVQYDTSTSKVDLEKDKRIDVAIRYSALVYEDWVKTPLKGETIAAYGTSDLVHKASQGKEVRLFDTHWQNPDLKTIDWQNWFQKADIADNTQYQIRHYEQEHYAINAALAGQGLVLASTLLVEEYVKNGWLVPWKPEVDLPGIPYNAYCLPEKLKLAKVRGFIDWLKGRRTDSSP